MKQSPIRIENAHKYYNRGKDTELHVMDDVSLELPDAGMVAIFGRSGCGKTTLLNAVGGLDRIASGRIEIFGQSIREDTDTLRNKYIGYIFQNYNLNVGETVFENVATALRLCGMEDEEEISARTLAALANVEMDKYRDRTPDTLSGGQQQRVAIARALVKNPAIILADEPTGNLDEQNTVMVMDILKQLSKTRLVLLVTHEAHLVDHYCDRVIEIVDGRIESDRENLNANGYIQRNKNHIYLGELSKTETTVAGVNLEYYGEPDKTLTVRVVNQNGKLFVQVDDPTAKLLDGGSEIKLVEGVFEETVAVETRESRIKELDMSRFAPFEGKRFGRLFGWRRSLRYAWRENFRKGKKKGKGLLRACLFLLAVVMVFMTASFGAVIRSYSEMRSDHNERLFYVPIHPERDQTALNDLVGKHGVTYTGIIGWDPIYERETLEFRAANFMTADNVFLSADARQISLSQARGLPVVAGTAQPAERDGIVISTALAEKLLDTATVSYLREPADLIGMVSTRTYYFSDNIRLRIAGVVESDELFFYMNDLALAANILNGYFYLPVSYASSTGFEVNDGEIIIFDNGYADSDGHGIGDTVSIMGRSFRIARIVRMYDSIELYPDYVKDTFGETVYTDPMSYAAEVLGLDELTEQAEYTWLLEHYFTHMQAFLTEMIATRPSYEEVSYEEWLVSTRGHIGAYILLMGYDHYRVGGSYLYKQMHGAYPTTEELNEFLRSPDYQLTDEISTDSKQLFMEYDRFMESRNYGGYQTNIGAVVSDGDYITLSGSVGPSDDWLIPRQMLHYFEYGDGTSYFSNHLMIRSEDPEATEAFLIEALGRDGFFSPEDVFDDLFAQIRSGVVLAVVSVLVVLILMCLCVFFIMRSSFMSRVREVGILRAIGVTGKNLIFRFTVETGLLLSLTTVLGYLISTVFISSLSDAALFSSVFYFPIWMAAGLLAVIAAMGMIFGILPAMLLLRKTPSEILSKYDI